MTDRSTILNSAILTELKHRPAHFPYPERALYASVRLALCPEPDEAEFRQALTARKNDGYVNRYDSERLGRRWTITDAGRDYLAD